MNGQQHYKEAERLVAGDPSDVAAAQVHATLALVAATVQEEVGMWVDSSDSIRAWAEVTS